MAPTHEATREGAANLAALVVIIAIGVAVRTFNLSVPLKYDEAFTFLEYARYPFWSGISNYSAPNNHLLHTSFVHLSVILFGNHDWALRLPAFVFGTLIVPASYALGRIFCKDEAALVAAALVAGSSKLVEYSVNARGYMLLAFLSIALVAIGFRLIRTDTARAWAAFAVVAAFGFFAIPTMLYVYSGVLLWVLASSGYNRVVFKRILIVSFVTFSMTVVLYLPALLHSGLRALLLNPFIQPLTLHDFLRQLPMLPIALWDSRIEAVPGPVLTALLIGFIITMFRDTNLLRLSLSFVIAITTLIVFQRVIPPPRVFLFGLPIVFICASSGCLNLLSRWHGNLRFALLRIAAVVLAAWMGLAGLRTGSVIASEETGSFQDITEVMNFLDSVTRPDDLVLMVLPVDQPFRYYLQSHATDWEPYYPLRHTTEYDLEGPDDKSFGRLFMVLRDHHGPIPSREMRPITLDRMSRFYTSRSKPKPAFSGPYTSVYVADDAAINHGFCEVFCFHRTGVEPSRSAGSTAE
jgi:hypothetical protein